MFLNFHAVVGILCLFGGHCLGQIESKSDLQSTYNTIAGPVQTEGSPGSKNVIFTNNSGETHQYVLTLVNNGKMDVSLRDFEQFGGSSFSATVSSGAPFATHINLKNTSSVELSFDKTANKGTAGKVIWRVDIIPRKK